MTQQHLSTPSCFLTQLTFYFPILLSTFLSSFLLHSYISPYVSTVHLSISQIISIINKFKSKRAHGLIQYLQHWRTSNSKPLAPCLYLLEDHPSWPQHMRSGINGPDTLAILQHLRPCHHHFDRRVSHSSINFNTCAIITSRLARGYTGACLEGFPASGDINTKLEYKYQV